MNGQWRFETFGGLRATNRDRVISRFRTQKTGSLLAYLAHQGKPCPREVLCDLLWPELPPPAAHHSLCVALSSLRHQLEPPGTGDGAVLKADRLHLGLNPDAYTIDVRDFLSYLDAAHSSGSEEERGRLTQAALEHYQGEFLQGYYENWVIREQDYLAERFFEAAHWLADHLERAGDLEQAVRVAWHALRVDAYVHEETHADLIRLLLATGQVLEAHRQYSALERALRERLGVEPSAASRRLAERIEAEEHGEHGEHEEHEELDEPESRPDLLSSLGLAPSDGPPSRGKPREPDRPAWTRGLARAWMPGQTVTLLVTTIEQGTRTGSGRQPAPDGEGEAPDALLEDTRCIVSEHDGREVARSSARRVYAFARACDAVRCATGLLARLTHNSPLSVALHAGDLECRDGHFSGDTLNCAITLSSAAPAGQALCTQVVEVLTRSSLHPGITLRPLGAYHLDGCADPVPLFRVETPCTPATSTAPRARPVLNDGLVPATTRFFGREHDLERLCELVMGGQARLLTLTGPGGTGKTRLALEAGRRLRDTWAGRVLFVPLAGVREPERILPEIAVSLGLQSPPDSDPWTVVLDGLEGVPFLLILDNFEHLVEGGADVVRALLERAPSLAILTTSRRTLRLSGEREWTVSPLPILNPEDSMQAISECESVQLFVDRAQAVRPDFQVTPNNAKVIADLCVRLEGIPLALELAAGRAQVFTPAQMITQMVDRFGFLVSRHRDVSLRHRTLQVATDWSYSLLGPEMQRFFCRLSVFRGGWTPDAAQSICEQPDALDGLLYLEESSLIQTREVDGEMRFRILETLAEFGAGHLEKSDREGLLDRHGRYYLDLAEHLAARLNGPEAALASRQLSREINNFRAVLDRVASGVLDVEYGLRLAGALSPFWISEGYWEEGRARMHQLLALSPPGEGASSRRRNLLHASVLRECALIQRRQGDFSASRALLDQSLALCREGGDAPGIAQSLLRLGSTEWSRGDLVEARRFFEESLAAYRETGDKGGTAMALNCLARFVCSDGDLDGAEALYTESLALMRACGDVDGSSNVLGNLGTLARIRADYPQSRRCFEGSLALEIANESKSGIAWALMNLGDLAADEGDLDAARDLLLQSLERRRELGARSDIADTLESLGEVALRRGDDAEAHSWFSQSVELRRSLEQNEPLAALMAKLARIEARQATAPPGGDTVVPAAPATQGATDARDADPEPRPSSGPGPAPLPDSCA